MTKAEYVLDLFEKWGVSNAVNPAEKGKYKGWSVDDLEKKYKQLKASGPHHKGSKEFGQMRELAFALRAKKNWKGTGVA